MALVKGIVYKGVECNYLKILGTEPFYNNALPEADGMTSVKVSLALYKDKTAREFDVRNYLTVFHYILPHKVGEEVIMVSKCKRDKIYKELKKLPELEGAEDD